MAKKADVRDRIQTLLKGSRKADDVKDLILDNCRADTFAGAIDLLAQLKHLEKLSMINIGLSSLSSFPEFPKLRHLDLSDNRLTGGLNHVVKSAPVLEKLIIGGNRIKDLDALEPLKQLPFLKVLDLMGCEITKISGYRDKVFEYLSALTDLDGSDRNMTETFGSDDDDDDADGDDYSDSSSENDENTSKSAKQTALAENEHEDAAEEEESESSSSGEDGDDDDDDDEEEEDEEDEVIEGEGSVQARKGLKRRNDDVAEDPK